MDDSLRSIKRDAQIADAQQRRVISARRWIYGYARNARVHLHRRHSAVNENPRARHKARFVGREIEREVHHIIGYAHSSERQADRERVLDVGIAEKWVENRRINRTRAERV